MCVHEELKTNSNGDKGVPRSESAFSIECSMTSAAAPVLQESFTITLGAQMKQMHNLRLASSRDCTGCPICSWTGLG